MKITLFCLLIFFFSPFTVSAASDNQFINIVNPVRVSRYTKDPLASIKSQYQAVKKFNLPATWLITYDVLERPEIISFLKSLDSDHEIGLFFEITQNSAKKTGIEFNNSGSWHHADALFLTGYDQVSRRRFIDSAFTKFKELFGNYPKSVGSWWIDSYSLRYIRDNYGSTANLGLADQFDTDGYQVWGQYWSTPFYPSIHHAGIPAGSVANKIDIVTVQWAPRDPMNGYGSSLYSTQDYFTAPGQKINYFQKLIELYAKAHRNSFGYIVVGLESDFPPEVYASHFLDQMRVISNISTEYRATTLSQFASWYRQKFPGVSPAQVIVSDDLLGSSKVAIWYQSPKYRLGLVKDKSSLRVIDYRPYYDNFQEPYFSHTNADTKHFINLPSVIDSHQNPSETIILDDFQGYSGDFNRFELEFSNHRAVLTPDSLDLPGLSLPPSPYGEPPGMVLKDWTSEAVHALRSPKFLMRLLIGHGWDKLKRTKFYVNQSELDTLSRLARLPAGNVLIADQECLQCSWHSPFPPAVYANHRNYVGKLSRHPPIANAEFLTSTDRTQAKHLLSKLKVSYIYLVNYEDYEERLHFSPGDWGAEVIYASAHAQLWRVVK